MLQVPVRSAATAAQVVRDLLQLEAALASIGRFEQGHYRVIARFHSRGADILGLRNPSKPIISKETSSDNLLRSTFAFNSDLGESFMILDTKGRPRAPVSLSSLETTTGQGAALADYRNRHSNDYVNQTMPGGPPKDHTHKARQNMRVEIENELNNPMVQSYLSTHAPSPTGLGPFDLTQSAMSTLNKDTIDNAEGVLNLLQTVRRIGTWVY
jgi:hypothetical protein